MSYDGGISFDPDLSGRPGRKSTAIEFRKTNNPEHHRLFAGMKVTMYAGDPQSDKGLRFIYPDFNNSETAPWATILHIETTPSGKIWLATKDGLRASFNGGKDWKAIARTLLGRHQLQRVRFGRNEKGGERIVAISRDWAYATDDDGENWHPFFNGVSKRSFKHIAASPYEEGKPQRWWILTRGGLWTNQYKEHKVAQVDWETARWAKQMIRETPPLSAVLDAMLYNTYTHTEQINSMFDTLRLSWFAPRISLAYGMKFSRNVSLSDNIVSGAYQQDRTFAGNHVFGYLLFSWQLKNFGVDVFVKQEVGGYRKGLHDFNRQIRFITEDVWHERMIILQRLAKGMTDELQIESLRFRIETLESIIETWARRPLRSIH